MLNKNIYNILYDLLDICIDMFDFLYSIYLK